MGNLKATSKVSDLGQAITMQRPLRKLNAILVLSLAFGLSCFSQAQDAVDAAKTWLGVRYANNGNTDNRNGIDCSALTRRAFRELQIELPRTSADQSKLFDGKHISRQDLQRNDLVFFWTTKGINVVAHVGVYIGGGQFIDANSVTGVSIDNIDDKYWKPKFMFGGRRLATVSSGGSVLLRPWAGNAPKWTYLMAYGGGGGQIASNSQNPWAWETWRMYSNSGAPIENGSLVYFKAQNGQFLSSDGSRKPALVNRGGVGGWELFLVVRENGAGLVRSGDRLALRGWQGQFLGANYNYGDWSAGCWFGFGGFGGWETLTLVVK